MVDVLLICMATGLMMLGSGKYNDADGSGGFLVNNIQGVPVGANWVQEAIDTLLPGWGAGFVSVAVLLFGFTCLLASYRNDGDAPESRARAIAMDSPSQFFSVLNASIRSGKAAGGVRVIPCRA